MDSLLEAVALVGVATGFLGIILLVILHFMLEARTGRLIWNTLSAILYPSKNMTDTELLLRRTSLTLFVGGSLLAIAAVFLRKALGAG